jgi:hypothetical protein
MRLDAFCGALRNWPGLFQGLPHKLKRGGWHKERGFRTVLLRDGWQLATLTPTLDRIDGFTETLGRFGNR